jgi:hypothetical protein
MRDIPQAIREADRGSCLLALRRGRAAPRRSGMDATSDLLAVAGDDHVRRYHRGENLASMIDYGDAELERHTARRQTHGSGAVRFELIGSRAWPVGLEGDLGGIDVDVIELVERSIAVKRRESAVPTIDTCGPPGMVGRTPVTMNP